jgi:hypothetical protein
MKGSDHNSNKTKISAKKSFNFMVFNSKTSIL